MGSWNWRSASSPEPDAVLLFCPKGPSVEAAAAETVEAEMERLRPMISASGAKMVAAVVGGAVQRSVVEHKSGAPRSQHVQEGGRPLSSACLPTVRLRVGHQHLIGDQLRDNLRNAYVTARDSHHRAGDACPRIMIRIQAFALPALWGAFFLRTSRTKWGMVHTSSVDVLKF